MSFAYREGRLWAEEADLARIAAAEGTPCYVYSRRAIETRYREYDAAFGATPHTICYAVKANSNLAILRVLAELGAGFDIVSGGELFRVLQAGGDPAKVVFSGVGKTADEIDYALEHGLRTFNCESAPELELLSRIAHSRKVEARVALRVNPDVDAATHPYITTGLKENKFGIDIAAVEDIYERARALPGLRPDSVSCHIGSQILDPSSLVEAIGKMVALVERLRARGFAIEHLDLGGGLGVPYEEGERAPDIGGYIGKMCALTAGRNLHLFIEPGRSLVGEAGVLLTRVLFTKSNGGKDFVVVDAAMNDLIRPSLYRAYHRITPVVEREGTMTADIVGPVCESGDFLAKNRTLPRVEAGDLLAVHTAGAYGFVMASNYNSRPRVAEILVEGAAHRVVRRRETLEDLVRGELR
jgi:diaminopimelate decarboxylase